MSPPPQRPDDTFRSVDRYFPLFGALFGVAVCLFLLTPSPSPMARAPTFFGGWLLGLLLPRIIQWHHYRVLGFVSWSATAAIVIALIAELNGGWQPWSIGCFAFFEGTALGSLLRFRDRFRAKPRQFLAWSGIGAALGITAIAGFITGSGDQRWVIVYRGALAVLSIGIALVGWLTLFRATVEFTVEIPMRLMYRVTATGPGRDAVAPDAPYVVIANHGSWFDPLMLALFIAPPIVPMMTSGFYDLPVLRWLMAHIFRTIRVPEQSVRREAPEVQEAVAALDARRCVTVFPEGFLRRKEELILRRFGQGIWHLLKARPQTPVIACWLEGVWGSYFSHAGGPPTKNKRFDLRRPIRIGMSAPEVVPAEILADPMRTRIFLMNRVLAARTYLGLTEVPEFEFPSANSDNESDLKSVE